MALYYSCFIIIYSAPMNRLLASIYGCVIHTIFECSYIALCCHKICNKTLCAYIFTMFNVQCPMIVLIHFLLALLLSKSCVFFVVSSVAEVWPL